MFVEYVLLAVFLSVKMQKIIADFLYEKDKEKTETLIRILEHEGKRDPAVITCDGFLKFRGCYCDNVPSVTFQDSLKFYKAPLG